MEPQKIPHHGIGLSRAEDELREGEAPVDQPLTQAPKLRLIMERINSEKIYYRVQDRNTSRNLYQGLANTIDEVISLIPESDRARIYEERRYEMGVGQ